MQPGRSKILLSLAAWLGWDQVAHAIVSMCQAADDRLLASWYHRQPFVDTLDELLLLAGKLTFACIAFCMLYQKGQDDYLM